MLRSAIVVPTGLAALSTLLIGLPPVWTGGARLYVLGLIRAAVESAEAGPDTPPASDASRRPGAESDLDALRDQNQVLAQKVAQLREENAQLRTELQNIREFRRAMPGEGWELLHAPIPVLLAREPSVWNRTLLVARGSDDGIGAGDPVVWGPRFVGRIDKVTGPRVSQVRLVTDRGFRMPVVVAPGPMGSGPPESLTGVLEGQGTETCALHWIMQDARIEIGWPVLTIEDPLSSTPPYLLVGRVSDVEPQAGPFLRVRVRPAVQGSNLTQVHVYKRRSGR
jgi:cell shape-determining protein MreC